VADDGSVFPSSLVTPVGIDEIIAPAREITMTG
jgi:hypothetical protein